MQQQEVQIKVITTTRQVYTIAQKVFCCKCFHGCQDVTHLTSDLRRQTLQRMIKNYTIQQDLDTLIDPTKLLILIYLCEDASIPQKQIQKCRINPSYGNEKYRTDLQFYLPQLCNFTVFHSDLRDNYLLQNLERACRMSFYFAHIYYFYIMSLEKVVDKYEIQTLRKVSMYREKFLQVMCKHFEGQGLNSLQFFTSQKPKGYSTEPDLGYLIKSYGTALDQRIPNPRHVTASDVFLPNYSSIFSSEPELFSFKSTINFFEDLFLISQELKNHSDKKAKLQQYLMIINEKLPACVYIPFTKKSIRLYNVLNIVTRQSKVFSTKERAPFYICIETFCPSQTLSQQRQKKFWETVEMPITMKTSLSSDSALQRVQYPKKRKSMDASHRRFSNDLQELIHTQVLSDRDSKHMTNKLLQFSNELDTQPRLGEKMMIQLKNIAKTNFKDSFHGIFGQKLEQQVYRLEGQSIYSSLQSWQLVHLIVKTGDNLKQEQFALQLIYEFDYIFKLQNLPLLLTPYEVISMGPDCGIMQMVKQSVTLDSLFKKLKEKMPKQGNLKQFFEIYYNENLSEAKTLFVRSLAAYCLVMYFLQVKDRHNGNILLHRSGKILHIDFGFFLSNMPGKGVQLEKDVPFKLMSQYIDVLDGPESYYFKKFRQYLFLGFKAARKHQNKILILVKMMYSSSGMTMPCFQKGQETIRDMQRRFNPQVTNDAQLNLHCQRLIDSSLDNWKTKWYDRFQYFAQGIVY